MKSTGRFVLLCCCWLWLQVGDVQAKTNVFDKPVLHPAIPLVDDSGQHVLSSGKPYSTRASCGGGSGGCHDIDKISHAYHFEMGRDEASDEFGTLRKFPALVSPGYFGGYNCMGQNNPQWLSKKNNASADEFLDYGAPGLIKACGECHSGGGFAEKDRSGQRYDQAADSAIRNLDGDHYDWQDNQLVKWNWKTSGVMENDCLICHADLSKVQLFSGSPKAAANDAVERWMSVRTNDLLAKGFFRYANSAVFAFLNVKPDSANAQALLAMTLNGAAEPTLTWNPAGFDENGKMVMPMLRFPASENCMLCHKTSQERRGFYGFGAAAVNENNPDGTLKDDYRDDVHKGKTWTENGETRDIENCNACHSKQYYKAVYKNIDIDADHNFPMGNGDMDVRRDLNYQPKPLSCEHCHNGPKFGGAENPALPSGHANVLDAHRELWKGRGDMIGYPSNTLDRVVQVHFDAVACQTCHITDLQYNGEALPVRYRYRYRKGEDGRLKMVPYNPASRYYWADKISGRVVSQRERLTAETAEPQTYDDIKTLKTQFDSLLQSKGYKNADTQMVWTESNEYLISHNTRVAVQVMPCDDCHDRKQNGSVSSIVKDDGVLGLKNSRTVAQLSDGGYTRLVSEGIVKLDMPYFKVSGDGKIVENVSDILYDTKIDPFQSVLRMSSAPVTAGEFHLTSREEALGALHLAGDAQAVSAVTAQTGDNVFWFNNATAGERVKDVAVLVAYNNASKTIVPNYRLEVAADDWHVLYAAQQPANQKKKNKKPSTAPEDNVTSSVLGFVLSDQQKQAVNSLGSSKMLLKLPYFGRASDAAGVALYAVEYLKTGKLASLASKRLAMDAVAVAPGNTATPGYVLAYVNELPKKAVLADIKTKKKGK